MPRRNGTGPMGKGTMTGQGFGYCRNRGQKAQNSDFGAGFGSDGGRDLRRVLQGTRRLGFAASTGSAYPMEYEALTRDNKKLRSELETIRKRIEELETRSA